MATRRMIDPQFWQSETVGRWTFRQRLLFIGLFSNADDQGRLRAHPALIRSTIFPYDDIPLDEITSDLKALTSSIILYQIEGHDYCQIAGWWKYQSPQWAYPSKIPPPDGWNDQLRYRRDSKVVTLNWPGIPDSLPKRLPKAIGKGLGGSIALELALELGGEESPAPENPDYLDDVFKGAQGGYGSAGIGDPSKDRELYFQYGEEALKIFDDNGGQFPKNTKAAEVIRGLIMALSDTPGFVPRRWETSVQTCIGGGVSPRNAQCMIDTYHAGGNYQAMQQAKFAKGNGAVSPPPPPSKPPDLHKFAIPADVLAQEEARLAPH